MGGYIRRSYSEADFCACYGLDVDKTRKASRTGCVIWFNGTLDEFVAKCYCFAKRRTEK